MPIIYTNRKGITQTLCRGVTKTGKPRYFFAREPKDEVVEAIPEGWEIQESVNGVVSLVKIRRQRILPEETLAVAQALRRHPKERNYRDDTRTDQIVVYELVGPDVDELLRGLSDFIKPFDRAATIEHWRADQERYGRFAPAMRFILEDDDTRLFSVERMMYLDDKDRWWHLAEGQIDELARRCIPRLGTDDFFELI